MHKMTHWSRLPEHLRRGLLRLYVVVSVPWVAWFGYQLLDHLQRPYYSRSRHAADAFWSLLVVPIGGPILLLVIVWVVAGFRRPGDMTLREAKAIPKAKDVLGPVDETLVPEAQLEAPVERSTRLAMEHIEGSRLMLILSLS
jgi:hypothetical protein